MKESLLRADPDYLFEFFQKLYKMVFLMRVEDDDFTYVRVSEDARRLASLPEDFAGRTIGEMYTKEVAEPLTAQYRRAEEAGEPVFFSDKMNKETNVAAYASSILMPVHTVEGKAAFIIGITSDLSDQALSEVFTSIEDFDYLTKLPNVMRLRSEMNAYISREKKPVQVLCINLDRFDIINEVLGRESGNQLLQRLAAEIVQVLPEGTVLGRVDADEFAAVLPGFTPEAAETAAHRVLDCINRFRYTLRDMTFTLSACIGISGGQENAHVLLTNASQAMTEAKMFGKNTVRLYQENAQTVQRKEELMLELELMRALQEEELSVAYQPKLDTKNQRVNLEVLARWHSPHLGTIPPGRFIPIAERSSLIEKVTEFVFTRVCEDQLLRPEAFGDSVTAVNVSANLFRKDLLKRLFVDTASSCKIPTSRFELEITEGMLMEDPEEGRRLVEYLRDEGFRVVIDDFGVSYSSLNYLAAFPLDGIKIDQSFIRKIDRNLNKKEYEIVSFIMQLAKRLNLSVTAEGVETEDQMQTLLDLQCEELQGYFLSRPVPIRQLKKAVAQVHAHLKEAESRLNGQLFTSRKGKEEEQRRLAALRSFDILYTDFEERYNRITEAVRAAFQAPISYISFITEETQWLKAKSGFPVSWGVFREVPRENTICNQVVLAKQPLVIEDLAGDEIYKESDVHKEFGIRFYAGMPLETDTGEAIGTLCLLDFEPRRFTEKDRELLAAYRHWVMAELYLGSPGTGK
ncbi:EAL domain-containing protein [Alkalicoccus urumqiensis]|uniref:EAL domain-containing protein n=1 Tax=Alkalicoccus urumqiensis TaxID=1548213 RepID=A0A2P6MLE0_ALKUR|nr:EAL domain-containing protein [Alkalicoccus urumqiensis]PRO67093.1 hypothetical protein C6I21_00555 [Alkalicoccus urumqiensis]